MKNETTKAIIRLIVAAILMINTILTMKGINPIPFDETAFTELATQIASGLAMIWVWWKNNNVTKSAKYAQESLNELKKTHIDDGEVATETEAK